MSLRKTASKRKVFAAWAAVAVWMLAIFFMSSRPGPLTGSDSGIVVGLIEKAAEAVSGEASFAGRRETVTVMVRKAGHILEYGLLAGLVLHAFITTKKAKGAARLDLMRLSAAAFAVTVAYAAADEAHQWFVPGRSALVSDVAIDAAAAFMALLFYLRYIEKKSPV